MEGGQQNVPDKVYKAGAERMALRICYGSTSDYWIVSILFLSIYSEYLYEFYKNGGIQSVYLEWNCKL